MPAAGERWGGSGYPLRVHVRRRRMTIEGASAAEDKNGNLLGFATTDEIGSVMDMTKTRISKYRSDGAIDSDRRASAAAGMNGMGDYASRPGASICCAGALISPREPDHTRTTRFDRESSRY